MFEWYLVGAIAYLGADVTSAVFLVVSVIDVQMFSALKQVAEEVMYSFVGAPVDHDEGK